MRLITFIPLFLLTFFVNAQDLKTVFENDEIKIESNILEAKHKGALIGEIRLVITNKTDSYIIVGFEMNLFYELTMAEGTLVQSLCIGPGKVKKGRIKGLFYQPQELTYAQLQSDDLEIAIDEFKATRVEKCK